MKKFYSRFFCTILFIAALFAKVHAQGDEPWFNSSAAVWNSNSNMTHIYVTSTAWTAYTVTTAASIGNPTAPCATPTNDQWFRIPHNGCNNIRVTINWENTNTAASRRARYAIYRGSSCTSSSCNLTLLTSNCFNTGTSSDCFGNTLVTNRPDVSYSAGEFIFVRLWDQDNSASSRANIYAICGASNSPSTPNNENCATPTYITSNGGCSGTGWGAPSGGYPALGPDNCTWGVNENPVFYEFTATATTMNLTIDGVRCLAPACNGLGSSLQMAVFPKVSPCSSTNVNSRINAVGNSTQDCYSGVGFVGGDFSGLTVGAKYLILLDGLNGARCSWTGISINNAASLPTLNTTSANLCTSTNNQVTFTLNNWLSGYSVIWSASPSDASLAGQTTNSSITVSPSQATTYTATINLGSGGRLCSGQLASAYTLTATVNVSPPAISQQPASASVCAGSSTSLSIDDTRTKQWQYNNGGTWQNVGSNPAGVTYTNPTGNTLGIATTLGTTPPGTYQYRVLVGTGGCQVTSNTATLTVVGASRNNPTGPQCSGTELNFSAFPATGATYSWTVTPPSGTSAAPTSGTAVNFSFVPTNVTGTNQTFSVASAITVGALTCNRTFGPTVYSAAVPPVLSGSGSSQNACVNGTAAVSGMGSSPAAAYSWSENGAGSITAGGTTLTPTYTPAVGDAGTTVTLTLTATITDGVNNCPSGIATATYLVIVDPLPTASAGGTAPGCSANGTATVSGASASNGTIAWAENGAGSITAGANTLTPTYTAAIGDAGNTVTLFMTVTSNNACAPETASATYTINVAPLPVAPTLSGQTNP